MKFDPTLYLVTDSTGRTDDDFLSILEKALTGGVTLVQLREKERGGGEYLRLARLTKAVCDRYRVPLIIDDRADIAMAADAAGVHVGQSDLPVCEARKLLGEDKIVGATAKTVEQAQKAYREGADYLGTGAIFPTTTKVKTVLTPEEYTAARESTLTAFYTPPEVTTAIYNALSQMGFREGNLLEPSCGIGNFIGMLPLRFMAWSLTRFLPVSHSSFIRNPLSPPVVLRKLMYPTASLTE